MDYSGYMDDTGIRLQMNTNGMRIGTLIGYELDNTYEFHGVVEPMIFNFPTGKFTKTGESTPQMLFLSFWGRLPIFQVKSLLSA